MKLLTDESTTLPTIKPFFPKGIVTVFVDKSVNEVDVGEFLVILGDDRYALLKLIFIFAGLDVYSWHYVTFTLHRLAGNCFFPFYYLGEKDWEWRYPRSGCRL